MGGRVPCGDDADAALAAARVASVEQLSCRGGHAARRRVLAAVWRRTGRDAPLRAGEAAVGGAADVPVVGGAYGTRTYTSWTRR